MSVAVGSLVTTTGKKIVMDRTFNASPTRTQPSVYVLGYINGTPIVADTDLDYPIPLTGSVIKDTCEDTFTGATGGDNSTDNSTTYKAEANGAVDNVGQNLIANGTNVNKIWTLSPVDSNFASSDYAGFWLYIKDAATLAKVVNTSGHAAVARFRSDATNHYQASFEIGYLQTGWNWMYCGLISSLDVTGSPGTLDEFYIVIVTNNATDTFVAGDVVIDTLHTWTLANTKKTITSVSVDETLLQATIRGDITTTEAVGYAVSGVMLKNSAGDSFTETTINEKSKGSTDEFTLVTRPRHA